jgi:hypothetical protein
MVSLKYHIPYSCTIQVDTEMPSMTDAVVDAHLRRLASGASTG